MSRVGLNHDPLYPGAAKFTGGGACSGLYRGLRLWAAAATEAGSPSQTDVIAALDHAQIAEGPGGPAAMVPGQHHVRMNMYIAEAHSGQFQIVENLDAIRSTGATRRHPARHCLNEAPQPQPGKQLIQKRRRKQCCSQQPKCRISTAP
jgi:Periplasmic binding protein